MNIITLRYLYIHVYVYVKYGKSRLWARPPSQILDIAFL